jgi:3-methyladenine DNA glycosylase AlkD
MDYAAVLTELESLGTAQNRKVYARHGVAGPMFGVSFAHLGALAKRLKTNHPLAVALWASGNHDARLLATMVADRERLERATARRWCKQLSNYVLTDGFAKLVSRSASARPLAAEWIESASEWVGAAGWTVVALLAMREEADVERWLESLVPRIARGIHRAKNRTRYAMNNALIAIGVRNARLRKLALAAAREIGPVEVDHGQTSCQTPDAASYIRKTVAHRKRKAAKR